MDKIWLASMVVCAAAVAGCQSGGKSHECHCGTEMSHKDHDHDDKDDAKDEDGKEETITADKVPAVVMNSFKKAFPGVTIEKIEKETYADGTVHYEIEYKDKAGKEQDVELNSDGEVLEDH